MPLAFAAPWMLAALAALPLIWWLLRHTPPRPRDVIFAPLRLLQGLKPREEQPQSTPWWLLALRMLLAACVIAALSGPALAPRMQLPSGTDSPLVLIIDNGWPAAKGWDKRLEVLIDAAEQAGQSASPVLVVPTARDHDALPASARADEAADQLRALAPRPYQPERASLIAPLTKALGELKNPRIIWASDGVNTPGTADFIALLQEKAANRVLLLSDDVLLPRLLPPPVNGAQDLAVSVHRLSPVSAPDGLIRAVDSKGRPLAELPFAFAKDALKAELHIVLPTQLRNDIARLEIAGEPAAGAVQLLDERFRRRIIGLYSGTNTDKAQPLLSPLHFLIRASEPFADVRESPHNALAPALEDFITRKVSAILLADTAPVPKALEPKLEQWLRAGGVLIRFAGPRLNASGQTDPFLPVSLRDTTRTLGGALTWEQPQSLAPFAGNSPFAGLTPAPDIRITRQILAEPGPDLAARTWAELADGTPLVTVKGFGAGWSVLVHVTADPTWSNLPLSGTFLEMLRRMVALASNAGDKAADAQARGSQAPKTTDNPALPPLRSLDASGRMGPPPAHAKPAPLMRLASPPDRDHPPGLYGRDDAHVALNAVRNIEAWTLLAALPAAASLPKSGYERANAQDLRPALLTLALILLIMDGLAILWLAGARFGLRRLLPLLLLLLVPLPGPVHAETTTHQTIPPALEELRIGYVLTGIGDIDDISKAGINGLSRTLARRTSVRVGDAAGVDIAKDELAFYPLLYWPIDPRQPKPDAATMARIDAYMKNGGTILFDTRDQSSARPDGRGTTDTPGLAALRALLADLDIPPLEQVPPDHVLTKAFYLLNAFPGRFDDAPLWTERTPENKGDTERPVRMADGISPLLITTGDFAGAWAMDDNEVPLLPLYGQDTRQREMALRSGVNIMIYLLTGNYKADQVHVRDILNRIGK